MKEEALQWFNIECNSVAVESFGGYHGSWYTFGEYVIYTEPNTPDTKSPGINLYLIQDIIDFYSRAKRDEDDWLLEELPESLNIYEYILIERKQT